MKRMIIMLLVSTALVLAGGLLSRVASNNPTYKRLNGAAVFNVDDGCVYQITSEGVDLVGCPRKNRGIE